ncbi:VOC family protein [archaeon]|nr:MAG: VOC family protein [archaeon]
MLRATARLVSLPLTTAACRVPRVVSRSVAAARASLSTSAPARGPAAAAPASDRPFRILGLQQVAIGGLDKAKLSELWVDTFGVPRVHTFSSAKENVDEDILRLGAGPFAVEVDIMQPLDATKAPKVHEPALNHIGLWVDNLAEAVKWLTAKGVRFTPGGIRAGAAGYDVTFIHPKGNEQFPLCGQGVLIELVQAPPEVITAFTKVAA